MEYKRKIKFEGYKYKPLFIASKRIKDSLYSNYKSKKCFSYFRRKNAKKPTESLEGFESCDHS